MTNYGSLRVWAAFLSFFGTLGLPAGVAGTIVTVPSGAREAICVAT